MNARAAVEICVYAGVIPAVAALLVGIALAWFSPVGVGRRYLPAVPFAIGALVGFACLPATESLLPAQSWEWTPYLGPLAAVVGGVTAADGVTRGERWLVMLLLIAVAAWLAVPTWDDLAPVRHIHTALLAGGMVVLIAALGPLTSKLHPVATALWLMVTAATLALLVMAEVSETLGTLAAMPAGALVGCVIALAISGHGRSMSNLALPYAVVGVTYAYTGYVYPSPPVPLLLLVPFAPLALWICTSGPIARLSGIWHLAAQAICVFVTLAIVAALLLLRGGEESGF